MDEITPTPRGRRWGRAAVLLAGGAIAGGIVAGTLSANAASGGGTAAPSTGSSSSGPGRGAIDESKSQRPDEHLLTGSTADRVRAAALAKYPGATVLRVETDSDGVYEAHLTAADGTRVTVEVGKDFAVTGLEADRHGGQRGPGGPPASSGESATPST